jgi:hypothetical protein
MGMLMVEKPNRHVGVKLTGSHPLPNAEGANFFHFTVINGEVQFLVGMINLLRFHEAAQAEPGTSITPDITHRFLLSPMGFQNLKRQLDEIAGSLPAPKDNA